MYGHKSAAFNLAFQNVSAYAEQFMLEFRLASFTVKSRRYVDFSNMGFVVPAFIGIEERIWYNSRALTVQ